MTVTYRVRSYLKKVRGKLLIPRAVVSLRYLGRVDDPLVRRHRTLMLNAFPGQPRWLAFVVVFWQWLRWMCWDAWRATGRLVRGTQDSTREQLGLSRSTQRYELLRAALLDGLHPADIHRYRLYKSAQHQDTWRYVLLQEVESWHHARDPGPAADRVRTLLSDKLLFADYCRSEGVSIVENVAVLPAGSTMTTLIESAPKLQHIAKPRSGSAARGVFVFEVVGQTVCANTLWGKQLADPIDETIEALLRAGEYLIQPLLDCHQALHPVGACANHSTVVRVITERKSGYARPLCAAIEIPVELGARVGFVAVEIELATGALVAPVGGAVDPRLGAAVDDVVASVEQSIEIPQWREMTDLCAAAHALVPGLSMIAWDVIPTPAGPVLIEGNSNWSVVVPQLILGPLLDRLPVA